MSMTRRQMLGSALAVGAAAAQTPAIRYREYARCLPDYLAALAADAYERRNARVAQLKTAAAIREYQLWARRTFLQLAGGLPERTPLALRTTGAFEREAYRVEKVVYESRPGLFVTANLYLPKGGTAPRPGVLFQMGHAANGKGSALYQRCCQGLAQLGYVVLAFDPMGQGERTNYPRPGGWLTRLSSPDEEHTLPGRQMLLAGDTATRMQLWDAIRSLDVLASHPQVDPKRLGSTGQSGGGTLTMILAAADDRLSAAAVSSGNTENFALNPFLAPGSSDDAEQDLIGSGPQAFDRWDLLWPIAPKPLLIGVSARDFFGTYSPMYERSGREEFSKLAKAYGVLGAPAHLRYVEEPLPHGLSYPLRVAIYDWFEKHLKGGRREIIEEPPTNPEPDETLWCGKSGSAVRDFGSKTPFVLLNERAKELRTAEPPYDLRKLLGVEPAPASSRLEVLARTRYGNCDIHAVEVASAPKVWVPAWLFLPKKEGWSKLLIVIEPNGRNGRWHEGELYPELAGAGIAVCAADVRGVGDLAPQFSPGAAGYARSHADEEEYAWASLILGHSLLGQRAADIAALARAIGKVYLARHLVSWRSLTESETYNHPLANFAPGILERADLPQIARSMAPRPVMVAGAVDAAGGIVRQAPYDHYREQPLWDFNALSGIF